MIYETTLPNGLEIVVCPTNAPVASVHVWVDVGSLDEKPEEAGYCHFLEHMLFKGTSKRTTSQIAGLVEGAGGEMNAFTSFEYTAYHITLSNKQWALANEVLADMVLGSIFKPTEFNPEKEVILEEIKRSDDSPDRQLYHGLYQMLWGARGYGRPVIGFPKTVSKCTASGLKQFWKRWYSPHLMTVVVTGDVNPQEVEKTITKTWGKAKRTAARPRRRFEGFKSRFIEPKSLQKSKKFPLNSLRWVGAYPGVDLKDPKLAALDVGAFILGQGESSRLYAKLFREDQSVTSIGAGLWAPAGQGMLSFDAEVAVGKDGHFRHALRNEIQKFCDEGPTADELERAKVALESERIYGSQSMEGLAHRLGFLKISLGNVQFDLEYLANVRDLTKEDVKQAAQQIFLETDMREFGLFPDKYPEEKFWGATEKNTTALHHPKHKQKKTNAVYENGRGSLTSLSNGIDLILFPREDVPVVNMQACVLGGLRSEDRASSGIGALTADLWEKGPQGWSAQRFSQFLDSRASRISAFSGKNSLGLSAVTLTKYLDDVLPVFCETLFNPAFDQSEFDHTRQVQLEDIKTLEDNLGRLVEKVFCENLFEGHPYSQPVVGFADSVSSLSRGDVLTHYNSRVTPSRLVVSLAGKFNPQSVLQIFERLQRPHANGLGLKVDPIPFQLPRTSRFVEVQKNREQSHLILGYSGLRITDKERYTLKVLTTVLGGQSGRLFRELRDKQGLCYVVAPISFEGIEPGYVGVYMGCDPQKREHAIEGIRQELKKLADKAISTEELRRAKEFILGRHHMDLQLNSTIATSSALNALYGLGYDDHLRMADALKSINAVSIQKLARRLFLAPEITAVVV